MKNILKIILCVLVCYIAIGLGWMTKDIIIHENGKDGIAILGYHGVVSEQEKKENYASNPYFMSISEFEKQIWGRISPTWIFPARAYLKCRW